MPVCSVLCDSCGYETNDYDATWCDSCCEWRCDDCESCPCNDGDSRIHDYDYRPRHFDAKGDHSAVLFGVELEVGGYEYRIADAVSVVDPNSEHLYVKRDGSISGLEIVTHPMSLEWARGFPFARLLAWLRDADCYVNDNYGLHIHVSRRAFQTCGKASASHQLVWLLFLYRNADMLVKLARRESEEWAAFCKPERGELVRKASRVDRSNRYVAVNCNNVHTYELRFFKSTLTDAEFWAALEFADASVAYTRQLKAHDVLRGKALSWASFREWVAGQDYASLIGQI